MHLRIICDNVSSVGSIRVRPLGPGPAGTLGQTTTDGAMNRFSPLKEHLEVALRRTMQAAVVGGLLMVAFVLGKRRGKRNRTVVEIRRV